MAKQEKFKSFKLPEALTFGYSFMMFAEHVVDRVPEFQSVAGVRKGAILLDAVAAAEKSDSNIVKWPAPLWDYVQRVLESDQFQMPKNYLLRNGTPTDNIVPLRAYLPYADAILEATDWQEPKSDADLAEPEQKEAY